MKFVVEVRRIRRLRLPPMRASIRDIVVAIAFGTIVYHVVRAIADGDETATVSRRTSVPCYPPANRIAY
jgi:hypothetical protein